MHYEVQIIKKSLERQNGQKHVKNDIKWSENDRQKKFLRNKKSLKQRNGQKHVKHDIKWS